MLNYLTPARKPISSYGSIIITHRIFMSNKKRAEWDNPSPKARLAVLSYSNLGQSCHLVNSLYDIPPIYKNFNIKKEVSQTHPLFLVLTQTRQVEL